ncbi:aminopeptidase P family protein [Pelomonas sp. CA6]|uniref:aminopeptidase P family protein n=1 Tax=Pelomonas sp. CA6 TaxID=2907999 RepID=UPI001F4C301D|nr:aminopeptidase P family protein [Pelomonas sp. CA6]MCH7343461.1 aminopeptidase P family protein [Pelomonas sp. CA6]
MDSQAHAARLAALRAVLAAQGLSALLIPSADPHLSEYLPERWRGRAWLTGFSGSVGHLVVSADAAVLLVDGRYRLQAEAQLAGTGVAVQPIASAAAADAAARDWLARHLPAGACVAVDGGVLACAAAARLREALAAAGLALRTDLDPLDAVWADRPGLPARPVLDHECAQAGEGRATKLAALRAAMAEHGASHHLVSALDEIAWLLNLRGSDVPYNPVFLAHVLLDEHQCQLFAEPQALAPALQDALRAQGVYLRPYREAAQALAGLPAGARLLMDPERVGLALAQVLPASVQRLEARNPALLLKSRRNDAQAAHLRQAMAQDGAALCEFYAALEARLDAGDPLTELDLHAAVTACRARREDFRGPSFETIAGVDAHAAMPHYSPSAASARPLRGAAMLLIDSGAHYLGGTTDITRVWPLSPPSSELRRDYTLVLKGLAALSRARFPRGTLAPMLDAVARLPLWAQGLDYGHGTGHGVGHYLNVHEGPQCFAQVLPRPEMALQPGMVISIEPGLYRAGRWGLRLENLVLCVPDRHTEFGEFLAFETLSLCPLDLDCVDTALLDEAEQAWLDAYHARVRDRLAPLLRGEALDWLLRRTVPLAQHSPRPPASVTA